MRRSMSIGKILGIEIYLHYSWWIVFVLLAYGLSVDFFPLYYEGFSKTSYWVIGILSSLLLFVSVLLHELSHSLVARVNKLRVRSITLFFFGGVASLPTEDIKPSTELFMAAAGPIFSLVLAGVLFFLHLNGLPVLVDAVVFYLFRLNLILGIFNLIPGYPLDGGRIFRSFLMFWLRDIRKATRIAAIGGKFVGAFLAFVGLFSLLYGSVNGLWFIFLGGFLYFIAAQSYEQVVVKSVLERVPLRRFISKAFTVSGSAKVSSLLNKDSYSFPVVRRGILVGMFDLRSKGLNKSDFVKDFVVKVSPVLVSDSSYKVFEKFATQKFDLLPVVRSRKVVGVIRREKVMRQLGLIHLD